MRLQSLLVLLSLVVAVSPALAGNVSYADMRGKWQSTGCTAPQPFILSARDSEMPANTLNAQIAERNRYVIEAHAYMTCIGAEAQKDSDALGLLVTQSAKAIIDKTQSEVDAAMMGPQPGAPAK